MVDFINDYRGSDNRDYAYKRKTLNKKQEWYGIKRNKISCQRSSARSYMNDMLVFPDAGLNGVDYFSDDINESEPIFNTAKDAVPFEWRDSIDYDQEVMRLYCVPIVYLNHLSTLLKISKCMCIIFFQVKQTCFY